MDSHLGNLRVGSQELQRHSAGEARAEPQGQPDLESGICTLPALGIFSRTRKWGHRVAFSRLGLGDSDCSDCLASSGDSRQPKIVVVVGQQSQLSATVVLRQLSRESHRENNSSIPMGARRLALLCDELLCKGFGLCLAPEWPLTSFLG